MKKIMSGVLSVALLLTSAAIFSSCAPKEELSYERIADTEYCRVIGVGTMRDKDVVIPDTYQGYPVVEIASEAFYDQDWIESVVVPDTVTWIGELAFKGCDNLKTVSLGENVVSLGRAAFQDCYALRSINIPEGVEYLTDALFSGCNSLLTVTIPNSVKDIGNYTFAYCYKLVEVVNNSSLVIGVGDYEMVYEHGYLGKYALDVYNQGDAYASKLVREGDWMYYQGDTMMLLDYYGTEKDLYIPEKTEEICAYAFKNRTDLRSVYIREEVEYMGAFAFIGCGDLKIYTEWESRPAIVWSKDWNPSNCEVEWGYTW